MHGKQLIIRNFRHRYNYLKVKGRGEGENERERQTDRQTGRQTERQRETSNAKVESFGTKSVFSRTYLLTDILSHASRKHSTKQGDQTHSVPKQSL